MIVDLDIIPAFGTKMMLTLRFDLEKPEEKQNYEDFKAAWRNKARIEIRPAVTTKNGQITSVSAISIDTATIYTIVEVDQQPFLAPKHTIH